MHNQLMAALTASFVAGAAVAAQPQTDPQTGLVIDKGFEAVRQNCTVCHSARLITQARASRDGWIESIRWMQNTQNLWQFQPETEQIILDYLAKHYALDHTAGRRAPLVVDRWYRLKPATTDK